MKNLSKRSSAPKKHRAIQTSRHLQVSHRRHTGHITPHRTTSYPTLAMILLCVGVFLATWTKFVTADSFVYPDPASGSYDVHLKVPGPAPTIAATIDTPSGGASFTDIPITVKGSCPVSTYVTLYRNGAFSGVALCTAQGDYELQTGLFSGANQLQARVFSLTDVAGPMSNTVDVTYTPPLPPETGSGSSSSGSSSSKASSSSTARGSTSAPIPPLLFKTSFIYEGHYVGQSSRFELSVDGGNPPYAISVDWGDGTRGLISRSKAGVFTLEHTYKKAGDYKGSYVVNLSASDADGNKTFLQLLSIVNNPTGAVPGTAKGPTTGFGAGTPAYLNKLTGYIWPGYGIVVLMLVSFWLGERRELSVLRPHSHKRKHA